MNLRMVSCIISSASPLSRTIRRLVLCGADSGLYLTEDNYIKSIEKVDNTNEIVTRLSLIGRDEVDIYEVNPLGTDYVENFDYFIENGEMDDEEIVAILKL